MLTITDLADHYQASRAELVAYLTRMVLRPDVAEELAQEAALRLVTSGASISGPDGVRPWLFRVGSRLAIDHLRRHSTRREDVLGTARARAEHHERFQAESRLLAGSPDVALIAREHLAVCFACTLRHLPEQQAAMVLLVEVHDFPVREAAALLDASFGQAKYWLQAGREALRARFAATCALVNKQGVCHQCSELNRYFNGTPADPLEGTARNLEARITLVRATRNDRLGRWHAMMMRLVDDLLGTPAPERPRPQ